MHYEVTLTLSSHVQSTKALKGTSCVYSTEIPKTNRDLELRGVEDPKLLESEKRVWRWLRGIEEAVGRCKKKKVLNFCDGWLR